jgi:hypothetical protein
VVWYAVLLVDGIGLAWVGLVSVLEIGATTENDEHIYLNIISFDQAMSESVRRE